MFGSLKQSQVEDEANHPVDVTETWQLASGVGISSAPTDFSIACAGENERIFCS